MGLPWYPTTHPVLCHIALPPTASWAVLSSALSMRIRSRKPSAMRLVLGEGTGRLRWWDPLQQGEATRVEMCANVLCLGCRQTWVVGGCVGRHGRCDIFTHRVQHPLVGSPLPLREGSQRGIRRCDTGRTPPSHWRPPHFHIVCLLLWNPGQEHRASAQEPTLPNGLFN